VNTQWKKSSKSGTNGGSCVEIRHHTGAIQVRDSKNPTGPVLVFTPDEWRAFVEGVHLGEFEV
jgi:Domain of unknown function (DUF397)